MKKKAVEKIMDQIREVVETKGTRVDLFSQLSTYTPAEVLILNNESAKENQDISLTHNEILGMNNLGALKETLSEWCDDNLKTLVKDSLKQEIKESIKEEAELMTKIAQ